MKKPKSIDLGKVYKGKNGPFFSFDPSITKIQVTREYEQNGEKVIQVLDLESNEEGYFNAFINKTDDYFKNKVNRGWLDADKAEAACTKLKEKGVSSLFQVKIQQ